MDPLQQRANQIMRADEAEEHNRSLAYHPDPTLELILERLEGAVQTDAALLDALRAVRARLTQHDQQLAELQEQLLALAHRQASSDRVLTSLSNLHP